MMPDSTILALTVVAALLAAPVAIGQTIPAGAGMQWTPTWASEFNTGQSDLAGWTYDLGNGNEGWGNWEVQNYTNQPANVSVSGGALRITAIGTQSGGNTTYTSGRIRTTNVFSQAYGLFEFRAKLPAGQGLWPAIWMMPKDNAYGGWPRSGEIDILENRGQDTGSVQGTLHSGTSPQTRAMLTAEYSPPGFDTTEWHTYSLAWTRGATPSEPATFRWYVDGVLYQTRTGGWVVPAGATSVDAPFDKPFYLIMNLAVGGNYTGHLTPGPGSYTMEIDYARAYELTHAPEPSGLAVAGVAAAALLSRRRTRDKSQQKPDHLDTFINGGNHVSP